jgi:hypothetical protein
MLLEGFEPSIPASERPQTHSLDRAATGIGVFPHNYINYIFQRLIKTTNYNASVRNTHNFFPSVAQQTLRGQGRLVLFIDHTHLGTHTHAHTHLVGFISTSDQFVAEAANYTTHNKQNRRTSMLSAEFELAIPGIQKLQTYVLARTATGIGTLTLTNRFKYTDLSLNY